MPTAPTRRPLMKSQGSSRQHNKSRKRSIANAKTESNVRSETLSSLTLERFATGLNTTQLGHPPSCSQQHKRRARWNSSTRTPTATPAEPT